MKKEGYGRKTTFEKKIKSRPGYELTRRVDRVWSGRCTGRSFDKPGLV